MIQYCINDYLKKFCSFNQLQKYLTRNDTKLKIKLPPIDIIS